MSLAEPRRDELPPPLRFLAGGRDASRLILERDWSAHPLGRPETWPDALKTALSLVLNSPETMILCWGEDDLFFFFNQAYFPLLGPRLSWATGERFERVWADAWEQAQPIVADAFDGRSQHFTDLPWKLDTDRGQAETWFSFSYSRILGTDGEIAGLFIFTNETTERVLADRALADSQAELAMLNADLERQVVERTAERDRMWETSPDLMVVIDFGGVLLRVNPAWTVTLGYAADALVGHHVNEFVLPDDHDLTVQAYESATGEQVRIENRYRHKDGSERWIAWTAAPAGDAIYATGRDVTADKARAAELERTQEQLRQAQKMEAVGQLTGGIAHDFNNMLTGVIGSLDLLKRQLAQGKLDRADRYIDAAATSAQRAAGLTHRLLAFSRRQSLDVKPVDANALVAGMEELLRRTLGENVGLEVMLHADAWAAMTDENQLESALLNLAINARDAMPEGGRLTIETANLRLDQAHGPGFEDLTPGDFVVIAVSDTGEGMSQEVLAHAFEPFFTTKPIGSGTGLGLSMIYGFARQSGGHARIYSEVGKGTTVRLYLPRHSGDVFAQMTGAAAAPGVALPGEQVLLVEDDPAVRMLVSDVLQDLGYGVREASDGREAMALLAELDRLDLLVTDVGLPGMDGRQLADIVREKRPGLKVLFVTGYAERAAVRGDFLAPGMDMITKPFAIDALAGKIREMLE